MICAFVTPLQLQTSALSEYASGVTAAAAAIGTKQQIGTVRRNGRRLGEHPHAVMARCRRRP